MRLLEQVEKVSSILPAVGLAFIEGKNIQKKPHPKLPDEPIFKLFHIHQ
jgi:hypothetical protein